MRRTKYMCINIFSAKLTKRFVENEPHCSWSTYSDSCNIVTAVLSIYIYTCRFRTICFTSKFSDWMRTIGSKHTLATQINFWFSQLLQPRRAHLPEFRVILPTGRGRTNTPFSFFLRAGQRIHLALHTYMDIHTWIRSRRTDSVLHRTKEQNISMPTVHTRWKNTLELWFCIGQDGFKL